MTEAHPSFSAPSSASLPLEDRLSQLLNSSNFDVATYLNLALASHSDPSQMAELALQLQLQTQSCHEDIGRIGAELQAILPRCAADVGRVGVGLEGMKADVENMLAAEQTNDQEVSSSLETLSTLHALQSNLQKTKYVLTAAATWNSTISSIPLLLSQQNLPQAVEALARLEEGEKALEGMPQHSTERKDEIAKIRMQVQTMLQPQLQHALQNMSSRLAPLQQCVDLYRKLGKMESLQEEYVRMRPAAVHKAWFGYKPKISVDETQMEENAFGSWLPTWYETVLSLLTEERRQSSTIFGAQSSPEIVVQVSSCRQADKWDKRHCLLTQPF